MSINTTALFTTLGRVGKLIYVANTHGASLPTTLDDLLDQYDGDDRQTQAVAQAIAQAETMPTLTTAGLAVYQQLAVDTLLRAVRSDNPAAAGSVQDAVGEVIRQMNDATETVARSAVTATPTPYTTNDGDGAIVSTVIRGDGLPCELCVAEDARIVCVADSYSGTATVGQETFRFYGAVPPPSGGGRDDVFAWNWPVGSGAIYDSLVVDATSGPSATGQVLVNGGFDAFTVANTPDSWTINAGTPGTQILAETSTLFGYGSTGSIAFVGNATGANISQAIADTSGITLSPLSAYAVNCWVRVDVSPAAGVLTIDLVDGSNNVVQDAEGTNNSVALTISTLTPATWTNLQGVFRLPKLVPATLRLRVRLSTALSTGSILLIDHLALARVEVPYPAGPGFRVFAGNTPWAIQDGYTLAVTNDRASATYAATFQALFARLFRTDLTNQHLPSTSGSPDFADTLITS